MRDPIKIIKDQIEHQTRPHFDTDMSQAFVVDVSNRKEDIGVGDLGKVTPEWSYGKYVLQRDVTEFSDGVDIDEFLNYSGVTEWFYVTDKTINQVDLSTYTNLVVGVQLFAQESISLIFNNASKGGILRAYTKRDATEEEPDPVYTLAYDGNSTSDSISISLNGGEYTSLVFTFYATESTAKLVLSSGYAGVIGWKKFNVYTPKVPEWADIPLKYIITQATDPIKDKITLTWIKSLSANFGGVGIYRKYKSDAFQPVSGYIPPVMIDSLTNTKDEGLKWFSTSVNNTLNAGDTISFTEPIYDESHTITRVRRVPKNFVPNPIFADGTLNWSLINGKKVTNNTAKIGPTYCQLATIGADLRLSVTSTFISSAAASIYYLNTYKNHNLFSNYAYDLGGFKVNPDGWNKSVNITSLTSTLINNQKYLEIIKTNSNGYINTETSSYSFYLSTAATYFLSIFASAHRNTPFNIRMLTLNDQTIYASPTFYSGRRFQHKFTPLNNGTVYFKLNVLGTTPDYPSPTMHLGELYLSQKYTEADVKEGIQVLYYNVSKNPCATTGTIILTDSLMEQGLGQFFVTLGGTVDSPPLYPFPFDCKYFKVGCFASLNSVGTTTYVSKNVYSFAVSTSSKNISYSIHDEPKDFIRLATSFSASDGDPVQLEQLLLIYERDKNAQDGTTVSWDDHDIEENAVYYYYLDAYALHDKTIRSALSAEASIISGDKISPEAPTSFTLTKGSGQAFYNWVNPADADLRWTFAYDDAACTNRIWFSPAIHEANDNYTESGLEAGLIYRYLRSVDCVGNLSPSVMAQCIVEVISYTQAEFTVKYKYSGNEVFRNELGWFKYPSITASIVAASSNQYGIASMFHWFKVLDHTTQPPTWSGRITDIHAPNFITEARYLVQFQIKDTNGTYSVIKEDTIYLDYRAPAWQSKSYNFWDASSQGYDGYNILKWNLDDTTIEDVPESSTYNGESGLNKINLYRSNIAPMTNNPNFEEGRKDQAPDDWTFTIGSGNVSCKLYGGDDYNGDYVCKLNLNTTSNFTVYLKNGASVTTGANYIFFARIKTNVNNLTVRLAFRNDSAQTVIQSFSLNANPDWIYIGGTYNTSRIGQAELEFTCAGAAINNYILIDEVIVSANTTFTQIAELSINDTKYVDSEKSKENNGVIPWENYLYYVTISDKAGNISANSNYKYCRTKENYRDKFANILDNSSFERYEYDASNEKHPVSWGTWFWFNGNKTFAGSNTSRIIHDPLNSYHGSNYLALNHNDLVAQTDIVVLPYTGHNRNYVISAYAKKSGTAVLGLYCQKVTNTHNTYPLGFTFTLTSSWERYYNSFTVDDPTYTNLQIVLVNTGDGTVWIDAVQLEERESNVPSSYYDTKAITADYLQGNLIRGHMIEADTITGNHIISNTIVTDHLTVGAVDNVTIADGAVTAVKVAAHTITAAEIAADTITTTELRLENANIYLAPHSGNIEDNFITTAATMGSYAFVAATLSPFTYDFSVGLLGAYIVKEGSTPKFCTNIFSYSFIPEFPGHVVSTLSNYTSIPKVGYSSDNSLATICLWVSKPGASFGGVYYTYAKKADVIDTIGGGGWSTPALLGDIFNSKYCTLSYYDFGFSSYYFGFFPSLLHVAEITWGKFSAYGSPNASYTIIPYGGVVPPLAQFGCISASGTIVIGYAHNQTVYITVRNTDNTELASSTFTVYGGLDSNFTSYKNGIVYLCGEYIGKDRYIILYTFPRNAFIYYKIIDGNGNVIAGNNIDIPIIINDIGFGPNRNTSKPLLTKTWNNAIMITLQPETDNLLGTPSFTSFLIKPRGVFLPIKGASSNVSLEELFNRLA